jgi:hypothetical protein
MEVRKFNNGVGVGGGTTAVSLAANFSSTTLNNFHNDVGRVYRTPCVNCNTLLPALDAPIGAVNYHQDMVTFYGGPI